MTLCVQVPAGCYRQRTRQPNKQPRGGGGHCPSRCEGQTANRGSEGGDQQTEAC